MSGGLWQRLVRGVQRIQQRPDWAEFAGPDWALRIMDINVTDDFHAKQGAPPAVGSYTAMAGVWQSI